MKNSIFKKTENLLILCFVSISLFLFLPPAYAAKAKDKTPPSTPVVTDDGDSTSSTTKLHAKWTSEDLESGIKKYKYAIGTGRGKANVRKWTPVGLRTEVTARGLKLKAHKTYYFSVVAHNGVNLCSKPGYSDGIKVVKDTIAPSGTIKINSNSQYTNSATVTLGIQAEDNSGGSGLGKMRFSNDNNSWSDWEAYSTTKAWNLTSGEGTRKAYAQFKDKARNISNSAWDDIILDTTLPIANAGDDQEAAVDTEITFDGSASSDNYGIAKYLWDFGDDTQTANGVKVTHKYSTSGKYTVTLSVTDLAGNGPAKDTAVLTITKPGRNNPPVLDPIGDKTFYVPRADNTKNSPSSSSASGSPLSDEGLVRNNKKPACVPNEIIVKFRPYVGKSLSAEQITTDLKAKLAKKITGYEIKSIERVFKDLGKDGSSREKAKKIISKFPRRSRRVKANTKSLPDLENIYKIVISSQEKSPNKYLQTDARDGLDEILGLCRELEKSPQIAYAEPNFIIRTNLIPDDPYYSSYGSWDQPYYDQWALRKLDSEHSWDINKGSSDIIVGVVDSGIDYDHPDLLSSLWINSGEDINNNGEADSADFNGLDDDANGKVDDIRGWDFNTVIYDRDGYYIGDKSEDNDPSDISGHGTIISGIIFASTNNSTGIAGVSWQGKILVAKGLGDKGWGGDADLANAIKYAADNGADIINMSFGGVDYITSQALNEAIDYAYNLGCLLVASAGGDSSDTFFRPPANNPKVIAVSAFDYKDTKADFSNWGNKIELAAPGVDILATHSSLATDNLDSWFTIVSDGYSRASGTSFSTAYVSGLAALILSQHPDFDNDSLRMVLRASSDDITNPLGDDQDYSGFDIYSGYGRINAYKALQIDSIATARITSPQAEAELSGTVNITGIAEGGYFQSYKLEYARVEYPSGKLLSGWVEITDSATQISDGALASWDTSGLARGDYILKLTVRESSREVVDRVVVRLPMPDLAGWPVNVVAEVSSSPAVGDLDGDGDLEVVVGSSSKIYAFHSDGSTVSGWPVLTDDLIISAPAIADIDTDGDMEVVVQTYSSVYLFDRNGIILSGWPISIDSDKYSSPAIADIDADGDMEIVVGSNFGIYAFHSDGSTVSGWPVKTGSRFYSSPAIADIDADGDMEIVVGSYKEKVDAFHSDGSTVSGWPVVVDDIITSAPAIADIDTDGDMEVVVQTYSSVYLFDRNGIILSGWPISIDSDKYSSPAIADIDADGDIEIVVGSSDGKIYAFHSDGSTVSGWPVGTGLKIKASPAIGDIDGDGDIEIVVGSYDGKIYALHHNGIMVAGWPRIVGKSGTASSAAIADLDGDGDMEIVVGSYDAKIYAIDQSGASFSPFSTEWAKFHHDLKNSGFYPKTKKDLVFTISATDADADKLTYSASNLPSGAAFDSLTATFSWRPTISQVGVYPDVHFQVSDGKDVDSEDITITVN